MLMPNPDLEKFYNWDPSGPDSVCLYSSVIPKTSPSLLMWRFQFMSIVSEA